MTDIKKKKVTELVFLYQASTAYNILHGGRKTKRTVIHLCNAV